MQTLGDHTHAGVVDVGIGGTRLGGFETGLLRVQHGLVQTLLVRLPMAYFMSIQPDASLTKIGLAAPVSTTVGIILNIGFFLYFTRVKKEIVSEE